MESIGAALMAARCYASRCHAGQTYGKSPYTSHLRQVESLLPDDASEDECCAAWLHDVVEDCGASVDAIGGVWGPDVAGVVAALTKPTTWDRIAGAGPSAVAVKVADRLANVRECVRTGHSLLTRYRREYPAMRSALMPVGGVRLAERWAELDRLLGWE